LDDKKDIRAIVKEKDTQDVVQVQVYDNFEELAALQQRWDSFVESVGGDIFLTYDWCRIWWKYYGRRRRLQIFLFFDDADKLVGIIPLFFERIWLGPAFVRAAKIVSSDFTGDQITIPVLGDFIKPVLQRFFESLAGGKWDILHIGPIAGLYEHYDDLRNACEEVLGNSHLIISENKDVQTYFRVADNWEEHIATLSKHERQGIRTSYNALQRILRKTSESLTSCLATSDNFVEFFEEFVHMHQSRWQKLGQLGHFEDWPAAKQFHREMANSQLKYGRLRLLRTSSGNHCLAYQYAYRFGDKFTQFLDARSELKLFRRVSLGRIGFCELAKKAVQENIKWIDSLRGKYEHKLHLGGELLSIRSLYVIPEKFPTTIRVFIFRAFARFLNLFYYKIWYCRIAPKLSFKRRGLWKVWIRSSAFH
jgi:CelD/BcsL family acetyltransferase involved in cellulose biosynthesis